MMRLVFQTFGMMQERVVDYYREETNTMKTFVFFSIIGAMWSEPIAFKIVVLFTAILISSMGKSFETLGEI